MAEESRTLTDTTCKWEGFWLAKRIKCSSGNPATLQLKGMLPAKGTIQRWVLSVSLSKKNEPAATERKKQRQKKTYPKVKIFSDTRDCEAGFQHQ